MIGRIWGWLARQDSNPSPDDEKDELRARIEAVEREASMLRRLKENNR